MFDLGKMDRRIELFVFDIYIAIAKIKKVASKFNNVHELFCSFIDWDSVIREFEIIGEASKFLLRDGLLSPQYQIVVDFRNQITHGYFGIDQSIVWTVIHTDLDDFENAIMGIIYDFEPKIKQELVSSFIKDNKHLNFIVQKLTEFNNG